ncbi:MAG: signal peptidase I [Undibacterium sp.]|nr:signal peptidase I [Opitutaceae bacterium]
MFGLFQSEDKKMRENAANWLELAEKVYHFRRDVLPSAQLAKLVQQINALKEGIKQRLEAAKLKLQIEQAEGVLRETGGAIYPKNSLMENVEFFVVAAIVILGIRTYFAQPFKIPTNSMWPTYYGMTGENLSSSADTPGPIAKIFRLAAFGAQRIEAIAPRSGEVTAPFFNTGHMAYTVQPDRTWLVFPTQVKEYTFYVDGTPATVRVPLDFGDFDRMVVETYFGNDQAFAQSWGRQSQTTSQEESMIKVDAGAGTFARVRRLALNRTVKTGDSLLGFDLLTGDQLFVDRMTYHFMRPKSGQGFVFRTGNIEGIGQDQYYIKRLIGTPGDVIEIKEPAVYRNSVPITGADAFELNAKRQGKYRGYFNADPRTGAKYLQPGEKLTVPSNGFFAMGDNSGNSQDGRYWGFVPLKDAIGRPLFIYYPFTKRWGPAR